MLNVYIGWDQREHESYLVAKSSIERRASVPVLITPLHLDLVRRWVPEPIKRGGQMWDLDSDAPQSTEFARSRFCIPKIQRLGWALFCDSDIVCLADIKQLFDLADDRFAVMVVKHDYQPKEATKMDGQAQTSYNRKLWSSIMLINTEHRAHYRLTHSRLSMWPGRRLHAFEWLQDEEIGTLPGYWNHLVGIDEDHYFEPRILHYTLGTPNIIEDSPRADIWHQETIYLQARRAA